jgi:hypothetical protein
MDQYIRNLKFVAVLRSCGIIPRGDSYQYILGNRFGGGGVPSMFPRINSLFCCLFKDAASKIGYKIIRQKCPNKIFGANGHNVYCGLLRG